MIGRELEALLQADYLNIEFIIINDRSTDRTGEIIDSFAGLDHRINAIHISELPSGWLGKVNALNIATKKARGEWLLYTDADIRFEPELLKRAVSYAEENGLDHLSLLPDDRSRAEKILVPIFVLAFGAMFMARTKARNISQKGSEAFAGVGAFNLVRRTAYNKTQGFEWLKMEVIDDVGLGYMLKQFGAHSNILTAEGLLSFEWYPSLPEAIKGLEKNSFAGFAGYSYSRGVLLLLSMWCMVLLPFAVSIAYLNILMFLGLAFLYFILPAMVAIILKEKIQMKPLLVALIPIGYLFVSIALLNSMISVKREGGIRWRDTFYPLDELRKGRRVKL